MYMCIRGLGLIMERPVKEEDKGNSHRENCRES